MQITKEQIEALDPCQNGYRWYLKEGTEDLLETLLKVNKDNPAWAVWLYTNLMSINQNRRLAIFAAEQVLHIFENEYPNDKSPRLAIEAAKAVLLNDTEENRERAEQAYALTLHSLPSYGAYAAHAAANAVAYAYFNYPHYSERYAADCYAAICSATNGKTNLQELIIKEAVKILEEKQCVK